MNTKQFLLTLALGVMSFGSIELQGAENAETVNGKNFEDDKNIDLEIQKLLNVGYYYRVNMDNVLKMSSDDNYPYSCDKNKRYKLLTELLEKHIENLEEEKEGLVGMFGRGVEKLRRLAGCVDKSILEGLRGEHPIWMWVDNITSSWLEYELERSNTFEKADIELKLGEDLDDDDLEDIMGSLLKGNYRSAIISNDTGKSWIDINQFKKKFLGNYDDDQVEEALLDLYKKLPEGTPPEVFWSEDPKEFVELPERLD